MTNSVKKTTLICLSMDLEEQGLTLLHVADLYRSDAKTATKYGNGVVAAALMKKAVVRAAQAHECLALSEDYREEAAKL